MARRRGEARDGDGDDARRPVRGPGPGEVHGWCPLAHPAESDDELFEAMTAAVFEARFSPEVVRRRWPAIRRAFADFHLAEVARWDDARVDALLAAPGIIRNRKKILATLRNARDLAALARRHGTASAWFARLAHPSTDPDDDQALVRAVDDWAHYIGAPSIRWFLRCAGLTPSSHPR